MFPSQVIIGSMPKDTPSEQLEVEVKQPNGIFASDIPMVIGGYGPKKPKYTYEKIVISQV